MAGEVAVADGVPSSSRRAAAQQELCETHYRKLVGYLCTMVGDPDLAEELAQEAFVRLFARGYTVAHPQAYLYLTATNLTRRLSPTRWRGCRGDSGRSSSCTTWSTCPSWRSAGCFTSPPGP